MEYKKSKTIFTDDITKEVNEMSSDLSRDTLTKEGDVVTCSSDKLSTYRINEEICTKDIEVEKLCTEKKLQLGEKLCTKEEACMAVPPREKSDVITEDMQPELHKSQRDACYSRV